MRPRHEQGGFTLLELAIGMMLSTLLMGAVFVMQRSASDSFTSSIVENRTTKEARDALDRMKNELRSCLATSLECNGWACDGVTPLMRFRQAVAFDSANGTTCWGADDIENGWVEYLMVDDRLVRRTTNPSGGIEGETTIIAGIDLDAGPGTAPVEMVWDEATGLVRVVVHRCVTINGRKVRRALETMIHIDDVLDL